ncbi:MAG TPA: 30S ribosomal protein S20 [Tenericutes bacterium]|nr:30S ribosomal protein S20 [Mycoplasmatota bacterium]
MPNMKNAKKKVNVIAKNKVANNTYKSSMRTAIKNVEKAVTLNDKDKSTEALKVAIKRIDKAAAVGVASKNLAARQKSRLTKKVNELS